MPRQETESSHTGPVMVAGHVCLDVIPEFPETGAAALQEVIRPGKLVHVGPAVISTGGPVSNTGIALHKLGCRVLLCARTGNDDFGLAVRERLSRYADVSALRTDDGAHTSYTVAIAVPGIDRVFLHCPGSNDAFGHEDLSHDRIAQCRLFHFGYPPLMQRMFSNRGRELEEVFRIARRAGATTSCDMALPDPASPGGQAPWPQILKRVLPQVGVFLPSIEETLYMLERERFVRLKTALKGADLIDVVDAEVVSRLAGRLLAMGPAIVALKCGHRGIYLRTADRERIASLGPARPADPDAWSNREVWCPAFRCANLAGATGSGDSAIAGFLAALLAGFNPERTLQTANCLGWQNVRRPDAVSGIESWPETLARLDKGMPLHAFPFTAPDWTWNTEHRLWQGPADKAR